MRRAGKSATRGRAELLLEIGCEEIPARMIRRAAVELQVILEKYLSTERLLAQGKAETFGAPRRLVAVVSGLSAKQPDLEREVTGPPVSVAYDNVGKPTRAAESFAAKQGVPLAKLRTVDTPKGKYLAATMVERGRPAEDILREILPRAIAEIPWPRTMYWGEAGSPRFIRPVRWLVALLDGKVIPFEFAGVKSGNATTGHRFLGAARIPVLSAKEYRAKLRRNLVIADPDERRKKIERELRAAAARRGLKLHADAELLELVTYLNEYPSVILGDFDPAYLELPDEILITVMRDHQKYFALERRGGGLAPHFLAVINLDRDRAGTVRAGHERVLRARFADARFFWEADQKSRLADNLPRLAGVTYESRLGSYAEKVERMRQLARWAAEQWFAAGRREARVADADRAAELAKCDLVTEMVREFTELQGIVGGLYARAQGESEEVAWAVYDHYRPAGIDDPVPRNLTGAAVALADKLDALVGCFAVGLVPTGSSDPFALRRAALGIVKIVLELELPLSLSAAVSAAARAVTELPPRLQVTPDVERQVLEFIVERARFVFRERMEMPYDEVAAALAAGADDLVDARKRLEALHAVRRTRNFEPLAVAFKRIRKILEKAGRAGELKDAAVRPELFAEQAERALYEEARRVARAAAEQKRSGRYREALEAIAALRPAVDRFFDDVLVMAEDEAVQRNRLALLAELLREFSTIADFSEIAAGER